MNSGFFSTEVGLFRALKDFLVQFGLAGDVALQKAFHELGNLKDDAPWLPLGPTGREINGECVRVLDHYLQFLIMLKMRGAQLKRLQSLPYHMYTTHFT